MCHTNIPRVALAVFCASIFGYTVNLLFVAWYNYFALHESPMRFLREVHAGVFGEFLIAYMGLALFSVLVITGYQKYQVFSVVDLPGAVAVRQTDVPTNALVAAGH